PLSAIPQHSSAPDARNPIVTKPPQSRNLSDSDLLRARQPQPTNSMTKKGLTKAIVIGAATSAACAGILNAQSSDALIDKLVEKGILSQEEAKSLRIESTNDFNRA